MITSFDIAVLAVTLMSTLFATMRGLTREFLFVVTWGGSAVTAWYVFNTYGGEILSNYIGDDLIADIVVVVGTFVISLIILHLVAMKIADFVLNSTVGPLDRTLGLVFGAARGLVIVVVLFGFMNWLTGSRGFFAGETFLKSEGSMSGEFVERLWESLLVSLPDEWEATVRERTQETDDTALDSDTPANSTQDPFGNQTNDNALNSDDIDNGTQDAFGNQ